MIKQEIKFQNYKECLEKNKTILKFQRRFRSDSHNTFTDKVKEIALIANDNERIQFPNGVISYPYGVVSGVLCKEQSMKHSKMNN